MTRVFTIGFTKTTAESFFARLADAGVRTLVDVRVNPTGQLSGFAKQTDLRFFADRLCGIGYRHALHLAPTAEMFKDYRQGRTGWPIYQSRFLDLLAERRTEAQESPETVDGACLLCSEDVPHQCHRRLVAEYLRDRWGGLDIVHL